MKGAKKTLTLTSKCGKKGQIKHLYRQSNIVQFIKDARLEWVGHVYIIIIA